MSSRARVETWAAAGAQRLRQHLMRAALKGTRDYAPDQTPELSKRGQVGPLSAQVSRILQHHVDIWAADARAATDAEIEHDENGSWRACIAAADAEIDRFLAGHKLGHGAAA